MKYKKTAIAMLCLIAVCSCVAVAARGSENMGDEPLFGLGNENTPDFSKYFTGKAWIKPLTTAGVFSANVTFEPGCRNYWHIHHKGGQILLVTDGRGWYQAWGEEPVELRAGDIVNIPAEIKHWHGAAKDTRFTHIAISVPADGASTEWCEPVTDEEYSKLQSTLLIERGRENWL
jgi:quercetin dioxygenase-like cupin family protein